MRELGERGDIIKAIYRALARRGDERASTSFLIGFGGGGRAGDAPAEAAPDKAPGKTPGSIEG